MIILQTVILVDLISEIKFRFPDTRITLSLGEKTRESYELYFNSGADRYLLRHETASRELYKKLHPDMTYENRINCLYNLKEIGYQIGAGFMVGIPGQTVDDLVLDLKFLKILEPHMVGIGPFIPHKDTPFKNFKAGTLEVTETLLAITRILLPEVLLPATTALGSIDPKGRERGLKAGANVVMPNLSPTEVREKYSLYDLSLIHISEPTRPLYISYAVFCLKKKKNTYKQKSTTDRNTTQY
eukprot:TRINITY_DN29501_c0_g1_i1.p2 TRINITY_DN29501_c0_g1~~TRINITY_DN29501_c0_g1_i1.p2  ORF type:complete len:242 (-),score=28.10 TRINITY_DN29501_c0_g1_i1:13-738(-)